ncbi:MAG: NAD-dependent epimerase/dehydratase family protein, partial [Rhodobacterales bacterium]|nr:NAD-dependent epimerase/dehydratase family protein [Rhodobacterales bacterium]
MSIFLTGGTGFLGSYVTPELLDRTDERITVFTSGSDNDEAKKKLWRSLQLHYSADQFFDALERIDFAMGDLHGQNLGLGDQWEP